MQAENYEVKRGKYLAFRAPEQKKFIRLRSLGASYSDDVILDIITGKKVILKPSLEINAMINIEQKLQEGKGGGYEYWATIHNLKTAANTLSYLQENNLTELDKLDELIEAGTQIFDDLTEQIKQKDDRMNEISTLQRHIGNYRKAANIYAEYKQSGYNKSFFAEHENILTMRQEAKQYFDSLNGKIPSIETLKQEYAAVLAEKKTLYADYNQVKNNMRDLTTARSKIGEALGEPQAKKVKKKYSHDR
jgi:hypothetical protein